MLGIVCDAVVRWGKISVGETMLCGFHAGKLKITKTIDGTEITTSYPSELRTSY